MKDAVHHLRHVQKKVIQSVRKSQAAEETLPKEKASLQPENSFFSPLSRPKGRQINGS